MKMNHKHIQKGNRAGYDALFVNDHITKTFHNATRDVTGLSRRLGGLMVIEPTRMIEFHFSPLCERKE